MVRSCCCCSILRLIISLTTVLQEYFANLSYYFWSLRASSGNNAALKILLLILNCCIFVDILIVVVEFHNLFWCFWLLACSSIKWFSKNVSSYVCLFLLWQIILPFDCECLENCICANSKWYVAVQIRKYFVTSFPTASLTATLILCFNLSFLVNFR